MRIRPFLIAAGLAGFVPALTSTWIAPPSAAADDKPGKKDDKPNKKEKQGTPTGEVHGGKKGSEFHDKAMGRLAKITVGSGDWVDSIRCTYDDEGVLDSGTKHGGEGGSETIITLEPDEILLEVEGSIRESDDQVVIGSLTFKTNKQTVGPLGNDTEGKKFSLKPPKGQEICGFQGRSAEWLDALGLVCRPK